VIVEQAMAAQFKIVVGFFGRMETGRDSISAGK
jgi:hypothetical protein